MTLFKPNVEKMKAKKNIKGLRNIGESSIPFLLKALANEDIEVREQAAYTLYDIEKPGINALHKASKNDKAGLVRKTVTDVLNRIKNKKSY